MFVHLGVFRPRHEDMIFVFLFFCIEPLLQFILIPFHIIPEFFDFFIRFEYTILNDVQLQEEKG